MPSQHEHTSKTFRPDERGEYIPAQVALADAGLDMNRFLRACLRWLLADPTKALSVIGAHLPPVATRGRPKTETPSVPLRAVEDRQNKIPRRSLKRAPRGQ